MFVAPPVVVAVKVLVRFTVTVGVAGVTFVTLTVVGVIVTL